MAKPAAPVPFGKEDMARRRKRAIAKDPETQAVREITLSYTFYPVEKPKSVSQAKPASAAIAN